MWSTWNTYFVAWRASCKIFQKKTAQTLKSEPWFWTEYRIRSQQLSSRICFRLSDPFDKTENAFCGPATDESKNAQPNDPKTVSASVYAPKKVQPNAPAFKHDRVAVCRRPLYSCCCDEENNLYVNTYGCCCVSVPARDRTLLAPREAAFFLRLIITITFIGRP